MYCTNCGTRNEDRATRCFSCGNLLPSFQGVSATPPVKVPNYLVPAILTTLCCCLPFGIPAIVFAAQASSRLGAGDAAGAMDSARKAKLWTWVSFGAGALIVALYIVVVMLSLALKRGD